MKINDNQKCGTISNQVQQIKNEADSVKMETNKEEDKHLISKSNEMIKHQS